MQYILNASKFIVIDKGLHFYDGEHRCLEGYDDEVFQILCDHFKDGGGRPYPEFTDLSNTGRDRLVEVLYRLAILLPIEKAPYTRQAKFLATYASDLEQDIKTSQVAIIGCGTVGASVFQNLIAFGFERFLLVDKDQVAEHNIAAQGLFSPSDIGRDKLDCLVGYAKSQGVSVDIRKVKSYLQELEDVNPIVEWQPDIVIDCFDDKTKDLQLHLMQQVAKLNGCYLSTGYQADQHLLVKVSKQHLAYQDFMLAQWEKADKQVRYINNRGMLADGQQLGALVARTVLNHVTSLYTEDQLLVWDLKTMSSRTIELQATMGEVNSLFSKEAAEISQINYAQLAEFMAKTGVKIALSENIRQAVAPYMSHFRKAQRAKQAVDKQVDEVRASYQTKEKQQKQLYRLLKAQCYERTSRLLERTRGMAVPDIAISDEAYQGIHQVIKAKSRLFFRSEILDYFNDRQLLREIAISRKQLLAFISEVLKVNRPTYYQWFEELRKSGCFLLDLDHRLLGKTLYLFDTEQQVVYSRYDHTYQGILIVLHELGHFLANKQMTAEFYFEKSNRQLNEVLAEQFVLEWLSYQAPQGFEALLDRVRDAIFVNYYRMISYTLDELLFLKSLHSTKDYISAFTSVIKRSNVYPELANSRWFVYNYLANPELNSPSQLVDRLMIACKSLNTRAVWTGQGGVALADIDRDDSVAKALARLEALYEISV